MEGYVIEVILLEQVIKSFSWVCFCGFLRMMMHHIDWEFQFVAGYDDIIRYMTHDILLIYDVYIRSHYRGIHMCADKLQRLNHHQTCWSDRPFPSSPKTFVLELNSPKVYRLRLLFFCHFGSEVFEVFNWWQMTGWLKYFPSRCHLGSGSSTQVAKFSQILNVRVLTMVSVSPSTKHKLSNTLATLANFFNLCIPNHPSTTLQGTNMSLPRSLLKMIFLFQRWDMICYFPAWLKSERPSNNTPAPARRRYRKEPPSFLLASQHLFLPICTRPCKYIFHVYNICLHQIWELQGFVSWILVL